MGEETTTDFKTEGQPAFPVEEGGEGTPSGSSPENKPDATDPSQGGTNPADDKKGDDAGFADHPRWKERENDWSKRFNDQETRHTTEIQKLREEFEGKLSKPDESPTKADTPAEIPEWFNGDEKQWSSFLDWNQGLVTKAMEGMRSKMNEESTAEQRRIDDATKYFEEQMTSLESDKDLNPQGEKIDKNKLLKFTLDNDLVDSKGRWNYRAALQLMRSGDGKPKSDATKNRKELAAAGTEGASKGEKQHPSVMTSDDFKAPGRRPW